MADIVIFSILTGMVFLVGVYTVALIVSFIMDSFLEKKTLKENNNQLTIGINNEEKSPDESKELSNPVIYNSNNFLDSVENRILESVSSKKETQDNITGVVLDHFNIDLKELYEFYKNPPDNFYQLINQFQEKWTSKNLRELTYIQWLHEEHFTDFISCSRKFIFETEAKRLNELYHLNSPLNEIYSFNNGLLKIAFSKLDNDLLKVALSMFERDFIFLLLNNDYNFIRKENTNEK